MESEARKKYEHDHMPCWWHCKECEIGRRAFRHVFGRGQLPADFVLVGEAPGESEDLLGEPFVGPAGQLLNGILADASWNALRCFFTNLVICRPSEGNKNREPSPEEIANCRPRLKEILEIAKPKLGVVTVGALATREFPNFGKGYRHFSIPHPAWLLRLPAEQRRMEQLKVVLRLKEIRNEAIGVQVAPSDAGKKALRIRVGRTRHNPESPGQLA